MGLLAFLSGASAAKKQANQYLQMMQPYINQYSAEAQWGTDYGKGQLQLADTEIGKLRDFWQSFITGTPDEILANVDAESITEPYDTARNVMVSDYVRGGLRASDTAQLEFDKAGAVGNLIKEMRLLSTDQLKELAAMTQAQGQFGLQYGALNRDNIVNIMNMVQQIKDKARDRASALTGNLINAGANIFGGFLAGRGGS